MVYGADARRVTVKCLRSIPSLACMSQVKVEELAQLMAAEGEKRLHAGEVLVEEDNEGAFFIGGEGYFRSVQQEYFRYISYVHRTRQPFHGSLLHRGYIFGFQCLTDATGSSGLKGFKIAAKTDCVVYQVTKKVFEAKFGPLLTLQSHHRAIRSMQRRPSATAPPQMKDVDVLGVALSDNISILCVGSFGSQIKRRANVSVHSFLLSQVDGAKRSGTVLSNLQACRHITTEMIPHAHDLYNRADKFVPR